jgi:hypothetical protein
MGKPFTWVIVAGVGALLLFAGLDALRSWSDGRDSATPTVRPERRRRPAPTIPCFPAMWRISRSRSRFAVATRASSHGTRGTCVTGSYVDGTCVSRIEQATHSWSGPRFSRSPTASSQRVPRTHSGFSRPSRSSASHPVLISYLPRSALLCSSRSPFGRQDRLLRGRHEGDAAGDRADWQPVGLGLRLFQSHVWAAHEPTAMRTGRL